MTALLLIPNVKTQWSSIHRMLRRCIDLKAMINSYVAKNHDLHHLELSKEDWEVIELVAEWHRTFGDPTTLIGLFTTLMISQTHTIFRDLQDKLRNIIRSLPSKVAPEIKEARSLATTILSSMNLPFTHGPVIRCVSVHT
ncbi:hypothetical protein B0H10DRAFT_1826043 [Mycena sp. CBHHK59/15]|nr:hypothetical protein B0H10DRAFT_1826043 [Mycena sp. CBHHK59/15]